MDKRIKISYIILASVFTIAFILIGAFLFSSSYLRLGESFVDFFYSVKYYFFEVIGKEITFNTPVTEPSDAIIQETIIPDKFDTFKDQCLNFFELLFDEKNFKFWGYSALEGIRKFANIMLLILPILVLSFILIRIIYGRVNTKHNKDTIPLKVFKTISAFSYQPIKKYVLGFIDFLRQYQWVLYLWGLIWSSNLNLTSIVVAFFAYYFYFAISFDFASIYTQFVKLCVDLQVLFKSFPWYMIGLFAYLIFDRIRRNRATDRLNHYELKNRGFINDLPIVTMTCGSMGKKKTTTVTDMALSQEIMFRNKAYEMLINNDMKFPYFPWISFEMELRKCMEHKTVYNLATCKEFVRKKRERFEKHHNEHLQLFGYDYKRYGFYYDDKLVERNLFDVLESYAQLYFIYVIESSLLVSNYSIREDNVLQSEGNFPMWDSNFFPKHHRPTSRHSHILDFDVLRLGKKIIEDNPNNGSFEFGVLVITEVGKERGNTLELKDVKKATIVTNQKNDLFNTWLKMCRHSSTVDGFPFIKVFTDEQRPESWGADARDLCDILTIVKSGETRLALRWYTIEEMIHDWVFRFFMNLYREFRFKRGDNTLLIHLLKTLAGWLFVRNIRIYNQFGYNEVFLTRERGTMDSRQYKKKYYISHKKTYSDRFSTDCFSDYFNDLAKGTKVGLDDYREYAYTKATVDELKYQNSYFIISLYKDKDADSHI